jgi:sugar lactone lactonase YvrE
VRTAGLTNVSPIAEGLYFPESPRWHDSALWFSDIYGRKVYRLDKTREASSVVCATDFNPSGLGWSHEGRLLIVAMEPRQVLSLDSSGALRVHADLSRLARGMLNDMVVAPDGTAYVGDGGYSPNGPRLERQTGQLFRLTATGEVAQVIDDLVAPNGVILTPDGRTIIVAETHASKLTMFDVDEAGALSGRRTFADLYPSDARVATVNPDGICLDADGAVWIADLAGYRVFRVFEGGTVTDSFPFDRKLPLACVLGGTDRRTLFVCVVGESNYELARERPTGQIVAVSVKVAGAGRP